MTIYDLNARTLRFAKDVRSFVQCIPKSLANMGDIKQLIRSSGSVGANYVEANESLGRKDFIMRMRICRKEAKESMYWLHLLDKQPKEDEEKCRMNLIQEAREFVLIFSAIIKNSSDKMTKPSEQDLVVGP